MSRLKELERDSIRLRLEMNQLLGELNHYFEKVGMRIRSRGVKSRCPVTVRARLHVVSGVMLLRYGVHHKLTRRNTVIALVLSEDHDGPRWALDFPQIRTREFQDLDHRRRALNHYSRCLSSELSSLRLLHREEQLLKDVLR